jgi:MTH538 TIR-like domain (DUF1863)/Domain of unknown function (DUF4406)
MLPLIIGAGIIALIYNLFTDDNKNSIEKNSKKRIFISFAIEDEKYRTFLVKQAKNENTPFSFVDMSVKTPWSEEEWKRKCKTKIKRCNGVIVLLSNNTFHSSGTRWEIKCAKEIGIPIIGMHIRKNNKKAVPPELNGFPIITWTWKNLSESINKI